MKVWKIVLLVISGLVLLIALDFGFGYLGVFKTKTIGKAKQNAQREVFEVTQSYVEGKRQEAAKLYKEWKLAKLPEDKQAIEAVVRTSFVQFDEQEYLEGEIQRFIYNCKYN
jgi:hypothetical protein